MTYPSFFFSVVFLLLTTVHAFPVCGHRLASHWAWTGPQDIQRRATGDTTCTNVSANRLYVPHRPDLCCSRYACQRPSTDPIPAVSKAFVHWNVFTFSIVDTLTSRLKDSETGWMAMWATSFLSSAWPHIYPAEGLVTKWQTLLWSSCGGTVIRLSSRNAKLLPKSCRRLIRNRPGSLH
jgi:hypothetical protein